MRFSFPVETVSEGLVEFVAPRLKAFAKELSTYAPSKAPVFYNPVMELNRDVAVLVLQTFQRLSGRELTVCEPMAGCGVRGIRLVNEVNGIAKVVINDINSKAYRLSKFNVEKYGLADRVVATNEDINLLLSRFGAPRNRFDYVDVDPFGSPMPYVDSAVRSLRRGGLLALTATDLAPLCGVHPNACLRKYGGRPLRTEYCHELALRLLAGALAKTAARYDFGVRMMFSHSSQHYVRLYAIIHYGARVANASLRNLGYVHHCFTCLHREASPGMFCCMKETCPECGDAMSFAGPLWIGEIIDEDFVVAMEKEVETKVFRQRRKVLRLLALAKEEAKAPITYHVVDKVCNSFGLRVPPMKRVIQELRHTGYLASSTHFRPNGIKTNAPAKIVKEAISKILTTHIASNKCK